MSTQLTAGRHPSGAGIQELSAQPRLRLGGFACEALIAESARLGISTDDLASFSLLYYLEDGDSGRVAHRLQRGWQAAPSGSEAD